MTKRIVPSGLLRAHLALIYAPNDFFQTTNNDFYTDAESPTYSAMRPAGFTITTKHPRRPGMDRKAFIAHAPTHQDYPHRYRACVGICCELHNVPLLGTGFSALHYAHYIQPALWRSSGATFPATSDNHAEARRIVHPLTRTRSHRSNSPAPHCG